MVITFIHNIFHKFDFSGDSSNYFPLFQKSFAEIGIDSDDDSLQQELQFTEKQCAFDVNSSDLNYEHNFFLPKVNFNNKTIPDTTEKVGIEYSSQFGRHIVALQDIQPGE